jgi:hypothetical protein
MLAEDARDLIDLIDYKIMLKSNVDEQQAYKTRQVEFTDAVSELKGRIETVRSLCLRGAVSPDVQSKADAFLSQVNNVRSNFDADPAWIIRSGNFNVAYFKNALKGLNQELDFHISREWNRYTERARHVNGEVLSVLGGIPAFSSTVQKIQILARRIDALRSKNPCGEPDFQKFDQLVDDMDKAWGELGSEDVPPSVMKFLRASGTREGATLDLLTEEVKKWLQSCKIEGSFRVQLKSQSY